MHVETIQGERQRTFPFFCRHSVILFGAPISDVDCAPGNKYSRSYDDHRVSDDHRVDYENDNEIIFPRLGYKKHVQEDSGCGTKQDEYHTQVR